ncbi:MAG: hypothetical protein KJ950_12080 [Proteobacteria bacterium]|nr:hypothetical protein [Pseudomonadota bacterium]MBU1688070.1 hypothetical protein [Pseudomonadota bacterium]
MALTRCGYHNPYSLTFGPDDHPLGIYLPLWENRSNELGLDGLFHQKTSNWLQESPYLKETVTAEEADLILTGSILGVDFPAASYSKSDTAVTLKARVRVTYRLTERKTGRVLWTVAKSERTTDYRVAADAVRTQGAKQEALKTIADEISEQIYLKIYYTLTRKTQNLSPAP